MLANVNEYIDVLCELQHAPFNFLGQRIGRPSRAIMATTMTIAMKNPLHLTRSHDPWNAAHMAQQIHGMVTPKKTNHSQKPKPFCVFRSSFNLVGILTIAKLRYPEFPPCSYPSCHLLSGATVALIRAGANIMGRKHAKQYTLKYRIDLIRTKRLGNIAGYINAGFGFFNQKGGSKTYVVLMAYV
jgi:hypothetical protein